MDKYYKYMRFDWGLDNLKLFKSHKYLGILYFRRT